MAKKVLQTRIEIKATPERVWQILTDFASFPEWNPFIRRVEGEAKEGQTLDVYIEPSGGRGITFRPTVIKATPCEELRWRGRLGRSGLVNGEHIFRIETVNEERVRFVQREEVTGLLAGSWSARSEEDTWRGFREMNKALKDRAELGQPSDKTG